MRLNNVILVWELVNLGCVVFLLFSIFILLLQSEPSLKD